MTQITARPLAPRCIAAGVWVYVAWLCGCEYLRLVHWAWGSPVRQVFGDRPTWLLVIAATGIAAVAVAVLAPRHLKIAAVLVAALSLCAAASFGLSAVVDAWRSQQPENSLLLYRAPILSCVLAALVVLVPWATKQPTSARPINSRH